MPLAVAPFGERDFRTPRRDARAFFRASEGVAVFPHRAASRFAGVVGGPADGV